MLQEGEEPTADGQGFKHRDRQVGPGTRNKARLMLTLHDSKSKAARRCEHPTERAENVEVYTFVQNVGDRGAGLEDLVAQHNDEPEVRDQIDAEPPAPPSLGCASLR